MMERYRQMQERVLQEDQDRKDAMKVKVKQIQQKNMDKKAATVCSALFGGGVLF